jgi:hypothetical protein
MLFARGFILQEKKIVRERYVFAGPLPSALPPPLGNFCRMATLLAGSLPVGHVDNVDNRFLVAYPNQ